MMKRLMSGWLVVGILVPAQLYAQPAGMERKSGYEDPIVLVGVLLLALALVGGAILYNRRLQAARQQAQEEEQRFHEWSATVPGMVFQYHLRTDGRASYPYASDAAQTLYELSPEVLKASDDALLAKIHPEDRDAYRDMLRASAQKMTEWRDEYRVIFDDGSIHWCQVMATPQRQEDGSVLWRGYVANIDVRKHLEEELRAQAMIDSLTDLPNWRSFFNSAVNELERMRRGKAGEAVLVMIDIDWLKRINETYGPAIGDEVLRHFGQILMHTQRRSDISARLSGEEFAMLLPETTIEQGMICVERIRTTLAASPVSMEAGTLFYTASFGMTIFHGGDTMVDAALARADKAMSRAKTDGRNRVEVA